MCIRIGMDYHPFDTYYTDRSDDDSSDDDSSDDDHPKRDPLPVIPVIPVLPVLPIQEPSDLQLLISYSSRGNIEDMTKILDLGVNVNSVDNKGKTALLFAAWHHRLEAVQLLISRGADVNAKSIYGDTAMSEVTGRGPFGPIREDSVKIMSILLHHGADVNHHPDVGFTPLMNTVSIEKNSFTLPCQLAACNLFIHSGARINDQMHMFHNRTALHHAVAYQNAPVLTLLLHAGAAMDITDKNGETPIQFAARSGFTEGVRILKIESALLPFLMKYVLK